MFLRLDVLRFGYVFAVFVWSLCFMIDHYLVHLLSVFCLLFFFCLCVTFFLYVFVDPCYLHVCTPRLDSDL